MPAAERLRLTRVASVRSKATGASGVPANAGRALKCGDPEPIANGRTTAGVAMAAQRFAPPPAPEARHAYVAADADRVRSRLMLASLRALLDQVRGSRQVLTHLAGLEALLAKRGVAGLDSIEPPALERVCSQLASLPLPHNDPPLTDLLGRLLDRMEPQTAPQPFLSSFLSDSRLMVSEATHSEFEAAARGLATTQHSDP